MSDEYFTKYSISEDTLENHFWISAIDPEDNELARVNDEIWTSKEEATAAYLNRSWIPA